MTTCCGDYHYSDCPTISPPSDDEHPPRVPAPMMTIQYLSDVCDKGQHERCKSDWGGPCVCSCHRYHEDYFDAYRTNAYDSMYDEPERDECCALGDWNGCRHQPASAYLYVPVTRTGPLFPGNTKTVFIAEPTADHLWECVYCGTVGTRVKLEGKGAKQ